MTVAEQILELEEEYCGYLITAESLARRRLYDMAERRLNLAKQCLEKLKLLRDSEQKEAEK